MLAACEHTLGAPVIVFASLLAQWTVMHLLDLTEQLTLNELWSLGTGRIKQVIKNVSRNLPPTRHQIHRTPLGTQNESMHIAFCRARISAWFLMLHMFTDESLSKCC